MVNCDRIRYINYYRFTSVNSLESVWGRVYKNCAHYSRNPLGGGGGGNPKLNQIAIFHAHGSSKVL